MDITKGTDEFAQTVSIHLLTLDLCTDIPVIITVFAEEAYQSNAILFVDMIWKSFLIIRCVSYYAVNRIVYKTRDFEEEQLIITNFDDIPPSSSGLINSKLRAISTMLWIFFVAFYWTLLVMIIFIKNNEMATKYEYYTWVLGMIGVFSVYDTFIAGFYATTKRGRSMIAFACLFVCIDWILHAFEALAYTDMTAIDYIIVKFTHHIYILYTICITYIMYTI